MENSWVSVYSTNKPWQAEIAKQVLRDNGFEAVLVNKQDSSYIIGDVEVFVAKENLERAKELIKDIES